MLVSCALMLVDFCPVATAKFLPRLEKLKHLKEKGFIRSLIDGLTLAELPWQKREATQ